jgi:hypothetical protein
VLPINRPGRQGVRPGYVAALVVVVALLVGSGLLLSSALRGDLLHLLAGVPGSSSSSVVPTEAPITPAPVETGEPLGPVGSGGPAVPTADTMPLDTPRFRYTGSLPWQIAHRPDATHVLEGYASRPSYLPGETLRLAVSTTAPSYDVSIWRVSGTAPVASPFVRVASMHDQPGERQPPPTVDPVTKMVAARWPFTLSFPIPTTWKSDIYLVRLSSSEGVQSYVPFVVRSPTAHRYLVVSNAMNWEAYNRWGGSSVYWSAVGQPAPGVSRALAVSFDRPYASDGGAGQLFFLELPLVSWMLRQHLDVAFTTDYDLSLNPDAQPMPKVVVFNGHDEYWGVPLYQWLDRHVNQLGDVSLAMLAADTGYWPVTFTHPTADGPRDLLVFKNGPVPAAFASTGDAGTGVPGASSSPGASAMVESPAPGDIEERSTHVLWVIPPSGPYVGSLPGQPIFGVHYQGVTTVLGRYSLGGLGPAPSTGSSDTATAPTLARLLAGTGLSAGGSLGFIAGGEVDGVERDPAWQGPQGGRYDRPFAVAEAVPGRAGWRWTAEAVWRELPDGARVFSSGTFYWGWALDPAWGKAHEVPTGFARLTANILSWLAGG